jgi:hypothetical protein
MSTPYSRASLSLEITGIKQGLRVQACTAKKALEPVSTADRSSETHPELSVRSAPIVELSPEPEGKTPMEHCPSARKLHKGAQP